MSQSPPRLRMFAGPNGSGKSTLWQQFKTNFPTEVVGVYVNADEFEKDLKASGLDLAALGVQAEEEAIQAFLSVHPLLVREGKTEDARTFKLVGPLLVCELNDISSYHAAAIADFVCQQLLAQGITFSYETVMSHGGKIDVLRKAQEGGFRTYLYFIATTDPEINVGRVAYRHETGGHPVAAETVKNRYPKSIDNLYGALAYADRAYIFDNSNGLTQLAEVEAGQDMEFLVDEVPQWFQVGILDKIEAH